MGHPRFSLVTPRKTKAKIKSSEADSRSKAMNEAHDVFSVWRS
jgi:hypothetical protein